MKLNVEERYQQAVKSKYFPFAIVSIILALFLFAFSSLKFILLFILIGALSLFYKRFVGFGIGFELVSFFAIISGMIFGPSQGFVVGFFGMALGAFLAGEFEKDPVNYSYHSFAMGVIGALGYFVPISNVVFGSLILIIIYDLAFAAFVVLFRSTQPLKLAIFLGTHLLINYYVFSNFAIKLIAWVK